MKNIITISFLLIAFATLQLKAQPSFNPEDMAKRESEWMKKELSLTEKQIPVVDSLNIAIAKQRQQVFETNQGNFDAIRPEMNKITALAEKNLKEVLSKEQFDIYLKKRDENRMRRRMQ